MKNDKKAKITFFLDSIPENLRMHAKEFLSRIDEALAIGANNISSTNEGWSRQGAREFLKEVLLDQVERLEK